jgi:hypothetical protein
MTCGLWLPADGELDVDAAGAPGAFARGAVVASGNGITLRESFDTGFVMGGPVTVPVRGAGTREAPALRAPSNGPALPFRGTALCAAVGACNGISDARRDTAGPDGSGIVGNGAGPGCGRGGSVLCGTTCDGTHTLCWN